MIKRKKQEFVRFKEVSCPALNVRTNTTMKSLIVKILPKGKVVECDKNFENPDWEHIFAEPNIEGYCMKRYLEPLTPDTIAAFGVEPIVIHRVASECDANFEEENKDDFEEKEK